MNSYYPNFLSYPFQISNNGRTITVLSRDEHIKEEIIQLIQTTMYERLFLPTFGGGVRRLVFSTMDETSLALAKTTLTQALITWLGHRIKLEDLKFSTVDTTIEIEIKYTVIETEKSQILVFQRMEGL